MADTAVAPPVEEDAEHTELLRQRHAELEEAGRQLQIRLLQYFSKVQPEKDQDQDQDQDQDYEQRYSALLQELSHQTKNLEAQTQELRLQSQEERQPQVERERRSLAAAEREAVAAAVALVPRLRRQAVQDKLIRFQEAERRREWEGDRACLENVRLTHEIHQLEASLSAKVLLPDGTSPVDCEQLKVDNQELNEKIDKQTEELLKQRKKVNTTVEVLSHVKEKLQWTQTETQAKRAQLAELEATVAAKRDVLTRAKQARDRLRQDTLRLRQRRGLLENHALLSDFEEKLAATDLLEEELGGLERCYAENVLRSTG